jgi:hypothetical protein
MTNSIEQTKKAGHLSDRYKFISTIDVVKKANSYGWEVVSSQQARTSKYEGYQKHIVIMENPSFKNEEGNIQLVIRNGHHGYQSLQVFLGFMRIKCANQLFARNIGKGSYLTIRHSQKGLASLDQFLAGFDSAVNQFALGIRKLQEKVLSPDQVKVFTRKALELRWNENEIDDKLVEQALEVRRDSDVGESAWLVMNRVQEAMVRGGVFVVNPEKKKIRKARKIKGIDSLLTINTKLMEMSLALV